MDVRPVRNEADYTAALAEIDKLMDAEPGTPEGDRLDLLATLVEAYEARTVPMPVLNPVTTILMHLENRGLSRRDLEPAIGSRARAAEILNRRRALTLLMIRRLHDQLGNPLEALVRGYKVEAAEVSDDEFRMVSP
jgi:HTH-type transcriptional regulator/antitoxin HigA